MRAVLLGLVTVLAVALAPVPGAMAAVTPAEPDPVVNRPVFNDPWGAPAAQYASFTQFARLIDRVPAGEEIVLSWFGFDVLKHDSDPTAHLLAAHARGVRVKVVLDQGQAGNRAHAQLKAALGADDAKPSFVVTCKDKFPKGPDRGCIATRVSSWSNGYNHTKFAAFSKVRMNNGTIVPDVVFTGSSNVGDWDAVEAYNDMFTLTDAKAHKAFRAYFADLVRYRRTAAGNNDYYTDTGSGSQFRAFFFPRKERSGKPYADPATDTVYNTLLSVDPSCRYQEPDGSWHQTDLRVVMLAFNRDPVAAKLAELSRKGCWVDVVYAGASKEVLGAFKGTKAQLTKCDFDGTPGKRDLQVHSKTLLIDGKYDKDITPRVYTGSHNYAWSALRQADEILLRITGRAVHDEYLHNFWKIRDTCRARA
ncbi:hypothetical protein GCM10022247_40110 [Allokutzneria multivorans]|uniref:phospholipase D n=1 Tax=Allokutzneria multivorans TaxID=1142134 RepID=A0ABP7SL68_9PSEU